MRISCIMPTLDSRCLAGYVDEAIECFKRQTWPDKELVIVAESPKYFDVYRELLADVGRDVTLVHAKGSTGRKRNIACQLATGDVIAHWDDDDYSAPSRLAVQANLLQNCCKQVTGFHSMYFTDHRDWWKYEGHITETLGTSLMFWRAWQQAHPFNDKVLGEDADFINEAIRNRELYSVDARDLMYATCHRGNTSPRVIVAKPGSSWREVSRVESHGAFHK